MRLSAPCSATTRSGKPCRFAARKTSGLCINHDPAYAEQQRSNIREATRRSLQVRTVIPVPLERADLSTCASIQAVPDAIVRLELTGQLAPVRARNLLRALSIAMRNLDKHASVLPDSLYYTTREALSDSGLAHHEHTGD
ncbi:MAG: hypothetical protein LC118_00190 [Dehalococcoidia bacterium]|nr:hypothetical protein [Dehalococcoidia bacterium]